jgi:hypothetical protein
MPTTVTSSPVPLLIHTVFVGCSLSFQLISNMLVAPSIFYMLPMVGST